MSDSSEKPLIRRACNIVLRTVHIAVVGVLLGGHYFAVHPDRLLPWLYMVIASGAALVISEAYPRWSWHLEARGWMVILKVSIMGLIPWQWDNRFFWLLIIIVIGSIGAHMPRQFRYFRVLPWGG